MEKHDRQYHEAKRIQIIAKIFLNKEIHCLLHDNFPPLIGNAALSKNNRAGIETYSTCRPNRDILNT